MILIAGGTGRLGTLVVRGLADRGLPVRVLTRDPTRANHLTEQHVEVVTGDVRDRASLVAAVAGATVVMSAVHGFTGPGRVSPATVDRDGNIHPVDAAHSTGADVVLMSVYGAAPDSPMELFRMKYAAEEYLQSSGAAWTIIRAAAFREVWAELLNSTSGRSGRPVVFGRGDNPINFVSVTTVAATVERAVLDPTSRGQTLEITGPENLTLNQLAAAVQADNGRSLPPRHIPPPALRLMATTIGRIRPQLGRQARAALAMDQANLASPQTSP